MALGIPPQFSASSQEYHQVQQIAQQQYGYTAPAAPVGQGQQFIAQRIIPNEAQIIKEWWDEKKK